MQHPRLVITLSAFIAMISVPSLVADERPYEAKTLKLSSLQRCTLHTSWIGFWPAYPEGVMLACGDTEMLVLQPNNLLGHVRIDTNDAALEYVRLFTSASTYKLFAMHGMVELLQGDPNAAESDFNVVKPRLFRKYLQPPVVQQVDERPCRPDIGFACGKEFQISRPVVFVDQHVYIVTESVYENGFYMLVSKRLLLRDASRIGVIHFGDL